MKGLSRVYDPTAYRIRRTAPAWAPSARIRFEAGTPISEIARSLNVSDATVNVYKLNGAWDVARHRRARMAVRPSWEIGVRAAFESGVPMEALSAETGLSDTQLRAKAKDWGWDTDARWGAIWTARRGGLSKRDRSRHRMKAHRFARRAMKAAPMPMEIARARSEAVVCPYCTRPLSPDTAQIDHIEPLAGGGDNAPDNLTACCGDCNRSKGSKRLLLWLARKAPR